MWRESYASFPTKQFGEKCGQKPQWSQSAYFFKNQSEKEEESVQLFRGIGWVCRAMSAWKDSLRQRKEEEKKKRKKSVFSNWLPLLDGPDANHM